MSQLNVTSLKHEGASGDNITLSSNGSVGIGTSSPNQKLAIASGAGVGAAVEMAGNGNALGTTSFYVGQGIGGDAYVYQRNATKPLVFGTANTERMRIDSAGRVTMPYQPCIWLTRDNKADINTNTPTKIDLTLQHQVGANWDATNNRFTCPISGSYFVSYFSMNLGSTTTSDHNIELYRNGAFFGSRAYTSGGSSPPNHHWNMAVTAIVYCSAGDYLELWHKSGLTYGSVYTGMTVQLIG